MNQTTDMNDSSPAWLPGNWCFFEHRLCSVSQIEGDGRVTEVTDGFFSTVSLDLRDRMFPMDLRGKCVSDEYQSQYDKLHKESRGANLNFPDFHRWLVKHWVECMKRRNDDEAVKAAYREVNNFVSSILTAVSEVKCREVNGMRIFR
jgi:hypothetical protein